jgi:small GTP-binding protein
MGNIISNYIKKIKKLFEKKANLLMLGLDNAGKTTILYKLKLTTLVSTVPTIGFNVETLKYKSLQLTIWDVGGQEKIRPLWKYYYKDINAIIFIIDSNDSGRFMEAKKELHYLANEKQV